MKKRQAITLDKIPAYGKEIAQKLKGGEVLALIGPLGSGKTTFTKVLGKELKIRNKITSPTFALMHNFSGKLKSGKKICVYHLDLYRINSFKEIKALGLEEFLGKPGTLTIIEWANKFKNGLPKKTKVIKFQNIE